MTNHIMLKCVKCGSPAEFMYRCAEHYNCDKCGTIDNLYTYTEGVLCPPCHQLRVNERIKNFFANCEHEHEIICPYCGYLFSDSEEAMSDGTDEINCLDCGNEFFVERFVTIDYTSRKLGPALFSAA